MNTMPFELKSWQIEYADAIAVHANNPHVAACLTDAFPHPYSLQHAERFIYTCIDNETIKQCCRAIVVNNEAVGSIGVFFKTDIYRKSADIAYWLAEPFWGKGIMTEAIKRLCSFVFLNFDIVRIQAEPFADNKASCKALEKALFTCEGIKKRYVYKNGIFIDSCMYASFRD